MKKYFLIPLLLITGNQLKAQDSLELIVSCEIFYDTLDEWLEYSIVDDSTLATVHDTSVTVYYSGGYTDTVYLDSGSYKFYVDDIGANVTMPIFLCGKDTLDWNIDGGYYQLIMPCDPFVDDPSTDGLDESELSNVRIFPNPANNRVVIENDYRIKTIRLFGIDGKLVSEFDCNGVLQFEIDLSGLNPGQYFVEIATENSTKTEQLIIR